VHAYLHFQGLSCFPLGQWQKITTSQAELLQINTLQLANETLPNERKKSVFVETCTRDSFNNLPPRDVFCCIKGKGAKDQNSQVYVQHVPTFKLCSINGANVSAPRAGKSSRSVRDRSFIVGLVSKGPSRI